MLSENNNMDDLNLPPVQIPTNFHMPTDYDALCQLLEHNHQHHFKTINEMCYGCDKLENDNKSNLNNQENENLNEKIEHIQPQNHEHLCSLHALQFYPCLEDNMEIIGELNTYANLDDSSVEKNVEKENKSGVTNNNNNNKIKTEMPQNNVSASQNTVTTESLTTTTATTATPTTTPTITTTFSDQSSDSFLINKNQTQDNFSMYIPNDFNENDNILISNGNFNSIKNSIDKQVIDNLIKNHDHDIKTVCNVLDKLPLLNNQKLNQQIINDALTYSEPLTTSTSASTSTILKEESSNVLNMLNLKNNNQLMGNQDYLINNKMPEVNNIDANSYSPSIPIPNNEKIASALPLMYSKSNSLPIYNGKDLTSITNESLTKLTTTSNPVDISINASNPIISNSLLSQSLLNINSATNNISYPLTTNTLNTNIAFPNSSSSTSSLVPPIINTSTTNISNTKIVPPLLPKTGPQETKSRFTSVARKVAPPLKVNPPKTYVKNTTIRNKSSTIDPEEKRRRNTEASARFRARKKFTEIMLKQQTHDLSCKCCELEKQLAEAKREIYWLKQLLIAKNQS